METNNRKELIIVGAGGLGRETHTWLSHAIKDHHDYTIKGFLEIDCNALKNYNYPTKILCDDNSYQPKENEWLVVAIADPTIKKNAVSLLTKKGARFFTLIHPSAIVGENVIIGTGSIICPNCVITNDITIGEFVFINTGTNIGHDVEIDNYTTIHGNVDITGWTQIGKACIVGVGSKIIPKCKIGENVTVGAGSVVISNIESNCTIFGNPAKTVVKNKTSNQTNAISKLKDIFSLVLKIPTSSINDALSPVSVKNWNSLNHMLLIATCEQHFSLTIEPEEYPIMMESFEIFSNAILKKLV